MSKDDNHDRSRASAITSRPSAFTFMPFHQSSLGSNVRGAVDSAFNPTVASGDPTGGPGAYFNWDHGNHHFPSSQAISMLGYQGSIPPIILPGASHQYHRSVPPIVEPFSSTTRNEESFKDSQTQFHTQVEPDSNEVRAGSTFGGHASSATTTVVPTSAATNVVASNTSTARMNWLDHQISVLLNVKRQQWMKMLSLPTKDQMVGNQAK
ncbi:hypothetical protein R1flu_028764 [Riccia fluitans]|uniref:Uncharacterized protein n=1 Tax=Riccia fluitans TaxID=41844 RepID=A0ABD1XMN3_9MARC